MLLFKVYHKFRQNEKEFGFEIDMTYLIDILCNPWILLAHDLILIKKKPKYRFFPFKLNGKWRAFRPVGVTAIFASFLPALSFTRIGRENGLLFYKWLLLYSVGKMV